MRRLLFTGLFFALCAQFSFSQAKVAGSVKGRISDTTGKTDLSDASVSVLHSLDSASVAFVLTNKQGEFSINNLPSGNFRLVITFQGYQPITKRFSVSETATDTDLGLLYLDKSSETLNAVVIERPPISIKKDTVEYSASMFTTKPNAVAEDLLKKMPGIQVDKTGAITAQGETVTRIMVNGKRFFSDDPKLATRNLPPDIIDKIQVFDDLSDQSKFTGFDDGNRVKTINITTKKDKQKGYFGKAVAALGTDQNYDESINMHRFDGNQQVSVLAQANDINKQNFTIQDILGSGSGGNRRGGGGGGGNAGGSTPSSPGITTVGAAGANYRDAWSNKTDAYGSYFFNFLHVSTDQQSTTKNISSDTSLYNNQSQSSTIQRTMNQRAAFNIEHRFDSSNSLIFRPNISFQHTSPDANSSTLTFANDGSPITSSTVRNSSANTGYNINGANLQFRHKFAKKFRTISVDLNSSASTNDGFGYNYTVNDRFRLGTTETLNQYYTDSLHSITLSPTISYTEPVGKNQILELNYNHNYNHYNSVNNTFEYDPTVKAWTLFDSLFSNSYKFTSNSDRFTLSYRIQNVKFNLSIGSGIQVTDFTSLNTTKSITVAHNYTNFTPTVNFQYIFSHTRNLRINYSGRTGTPTAAQLQPLVTTSDNLNFQVGNPNLKPQFTHSLRLLYTNFDPVSQRVLFATLNASTIVNDIQSSIVQDKTTGGRTSTYVNLNGTYNVNGYLNYGFALKKPKSNLNFITNVRYSQSQTLLNDSSRYTKSTTLSETPSWTTNIKKNFDMNFSAPFTYYITSSTNSTLTYFTQEFTAEFTAYTNNGWLIAADFTYTYYGGNRGASGYTASVPILSPSIAKQLFKKKDGELRLSVFDAFNKNQVVNTSPSATQITNSKTNLLSRYAMLTFTYNLNNFAGSQQKRMPGMFNNFRRGGGGGGRGGGGGPQFPL